MNYREETLASYEKHAAYFFQYFKGLLDLERRYEFKKFLQLISGKKILDCGCGGGDHSLYFQQQGLDVTGIDISPAMIALCKNKGVQAFLMDMESLTFGSNSFDGIWAVTSVLHVPKKNVPKVATEFYRVLRDSGILFLCLKEGDCERFLPDKNDATTGRFFAFWKEEEICSIFSRYFEIIESRKVTTGNTNYLKIFLKKS